jgi:aminoglycoside phosphotransferase (APT) family kinase protein
VSDALLRTAIEQSPVLGGRSLVQLRRAPSEYATSCPLEEIAIVLDNGTEHRLMLKHLAAAARSEQVIRHKPAFLLDPEREILVYRHILAPRRLGAALYAASAPGAAWPWLLVEKIAGLEMYQLGELDAWRSAAAWLGRMHRALPEQSALELPIADQLLRFERQTCRRWMDRCRLFLGETSNAGSRERAAVAWLAERFDRVIEYLMSLPRSFIHGEFYASNVLATSSNEGWRIAPIDWEMAAIGPGVIDVAALTSGDWSDAARTFILEGYATDIQHEAVDHARLYLAVQWLGWFGRRRAPADHRRDWLADALRLAEQLKL